MGSSVGGDHAKSALDIYDKEALTQVFVVLLSYFA
jgi:hypothetical protein